MNKNLASHYHHISNGGIRVNIDLDDEFRSISVSFNCGTNGYPEVFSQLQTWGYVDSSWLRKMSEIFLEAALEYEKLPKVDECD